MDRAQNRTQFIEQLAYSHEDPNQASKVIGAYSVRLRGALLGEMDSPERELALAVLERAVADLRSYHLARSGRRRRLYLEACRWVGSDDREWMYSFLSICEMFKLSPTALRRQLLEGRPRVLPEAA